MEKKSILTKILAVAGTILVWFPLLAPVLIAVIFFFQRHICRIDYLMPAELFISFLLGSGLLLWAALRAHSHRRFIAWSLAMAVFVLFAGQVIAIATGLASGAREPTGWSWALVLASLVVYMIGIILVGTGGILLLKDLFKATQSPA